MASHFLLLLLLLLYLTNTIIAATDGGFPPHLSFQQYRSIQSFAGEEDNQLINELGNNGWDNSVLDTWYMNMRVEQQHYSSLKIEGSNSKSNSKNLSPFIICDTNESERHGVDRYELIDSVLSEMCDENDNDKKSKYFIKRVPIYNSNVNNKNKENNDEHTLHGACFFSSIEVGLAKSIKKEGILVTPVAPFLKMRKNIISGPSEDYNEEESTSRIDEDTISLAVTLAPGVFSSHEVVEFASNIKQIQDMDQNDPFLAECDKKPYQISSVTIGSSESFYFFFYEIEKQDLVAGITHRCHRLFLEHIVTKPQVISVEKVAKNTISNFHAKWIVESGVKEKNPFKDIGLSGDGEVIFVADTGLDQQHCYIKDYSGETVPLTTDFDLTGKINHNLRKVVQYVALDDIGSDDQDIDGGHGTHVVGTIVGKRLNGNGQETQGVGEGIASSAKVAFYDGSSGNSSDVSLNSCISQFFYFGRMAGARINSSSWNSGKFGKYEETSRQVDEYFYNDTDDKMLMITAAGNNGTDDTGTASRGTVKYPCVSKNALCIGASYNYKSDIDDIYVVADFSSYGPTADGRIKPDLIAPGDKILSLEANSNKCGTSHYDSAGNNDGLTFMSGTSMACPVAAGAAALVREYFATGHYPTGEKENEKMDITGSLLKAVLINGAVELEFRAEDYSADSYINSTFYDRYQGFGRVNLLNSLKLANEVSSPDLYVENERIIEKGHTHEYVFKNVCNSNEFRVTLAWRDPPSDSGCAKCLVNDLDLEVDHDGNTYYPNGRDEADGTNNVERVIMKINPTVDTIRVKVKTANLGYGNSQKYSLASTGCFDINEVEIDAPDTVSEICGPDEFEYTIDIFTNRKPEETSWILKKQESDELIASVTAGKYKEPKDRLKSFRYKGCITKGCYIFIIKDTAFNGLCCEKGMGSYSIRADDELLIKEDSFVDRLKIEKFCNYGSDAIEPTTSPTVLSCNDDEFKYQIDIKTDLYPDETRWVLLRKPRIDGVDKENYTESYREYVHEGCLELGDCYSFSVFYEGFSHGEYTVKANEFVVAERESFNEEKYEEFCYSGETGTPTYGIRTSVVGKNYGDKFDDVHPLWEYGKIVQIEVYADSYSYYVDFIGITYETGQSFEHGNKDGEQHIIILGEDQYITKVSGRSSDHIRQIIFERNDGEIFGPYGYIGSSFFTPMYTPFEFDFEGNSLVYIFGRADDNGLSQLGFAHASLPGTITDSPTPYTCGDNQFRYEIIIRIDDYPGAVSWELHSIVESVPFMTYRKQLETYSHTGCAVIDENYEFLMFDKKRDGLCCYFESGSYTLSVDNNVVVQGNHFDDAIHVGDFWQIPDFVYNIHEFSYSSSLQPTSKPIEMSCGDEEFEYRIRVRTNLFPEFTSWTFKYSDEVFIEGVKQFQYVVQHYEYNHKGCLPLNECFEFSIGSLLGLCCEYGNGGYTIFANDVVMAEGGGNYRNWGEKKTFCYGPSYSQSPSSSPLVCDENEFKYEVIVTTGNYPDKTSWELKYDDGTIIDSVEEEEYTERFTKHLHNGCLDLDSCVIFTIFDSAGDSILGDGGYTVIANNIVMAEGGGDYDYWYEQTHEFCYGPSHSFSPSSSDVCEDGSNNHYWCAGWASIGLCEDNRMQDWMQENCAKACSNCCMDYDKEWICASHASEGRCTDTSQYSHGITWQEFMKATCRKSCNTCDLDFTPTPTPPPTPVICSDDQFKYEIIVTNDNYYDFDWSLYYKYKYPEQIDGYRIDHFSGEFPPGYEKRFYGCASYSCFELYVREAYLKIYNYDEDILIAQNTERRESLRFCQYAPEPITQPITSLKETIFTITLSFSTTSLHQEEIVSSVSHISIQKILFHFIEINEHDPFIAVEYSGCEEFNCDVSFRVCKNESCNNDDEVLQPDFLAFIANTLMEAEANGLLLLTLKQTGHHMKVAEIFDNIKNDIVIEFDFDYEAWPTTSPTTSPSSKPTQNCNQSLFTRIAAIMQIFIQGINNTITNVTNSILGELFGVDTVNSTADLVQCKDKMFWLQVEIQTDRTPNKTSWELLYENGTLIESVGQDTYSECNTTYKHNYCLDTSCFVFNMWDSFSFQGSYKITAGNSTLAQQDTFMWWKDTKRFCYPLCDDNGMFALQIDVVTDPWPHETSWQLAFENGTLVDSVVEGYYTGHNTSYSHRYCLKEGCYSVTFHDHIGDGMCCSYGKGSYMFKINDDEIAVKRGGKFEESESTTFCYPFDDASCKCCEEDTTTSFLFGIITALFGDESCCTTDTTGYPTPLPTISSNPSISSIPSSIPSFNPTISLQPSSHPSSNPSSNPSISSIPSFHPSSNPSFIPTTSLQPSSSPTVLVCDENEFKYEVVVTTDYFPWKTSWDLNYTNGTLIDSVERYTEDNTEHVHNGCLGLDSCVIFTIFDSWGDRFNHPGGYSVLVGDVVMAEGGGDDGFNYIERKTFCFGPSYSFSPSLLPTSNPSFIPTISSNPSFIPTSSHPTSSPTLLCDAHEFKYEIIVTTDEYPDEISWKLKYDDGTIIDSVVEEEYTKKETEHVHNGCLDLDSCVIFIIFDSWGDGLCCSFGNGGYTLKANDAVMAEGGGDDGFNYIERKTFCFGPSYSFSPSLLPTSNPSFIPTISSNPSFIPTISSNPSFIPTTTSKPSSGPTVLVCDENEFKYEIIVTTDEYPDETSWELKYDDGTIIDSVEEEEYTDYYYEHVHNGCLDLDSCVTFTIFDSFGNGICCSFGNGGYTIMVNGDVMAEGGEFGDEEIKTFCYPVSLSS